MENGSTSDINFASVEQELKDLRNEMALQIGGAIGADAQESVRISARYESLLADTIELWKSELSKQRAEFQRSELRLREQHRHELSTLRHNLETQHDGVVRGLREELDIARFERNKVEYEAGSKIFNLEQKIKKLETEIQKIERVISAKDGAIIRLSNQVSALERGSRL